MLRGIKRLPSPAMAVALVALFVAFAGSATAAVVLTGQDIKNGTLTGKDLKNRTLGAKKLSKRAIRSLTDPAGTGTSGPPGPRGPEGPTGPSHAYVDNSAATITTQNSRTLEVSVPAGSYTAQVNLEAHATGSTGQLECRFRAPADSSPVLLGYTGVLFIGDVPASGQIDSRFISYGGGFATSAGGVVELVCKRGPDGVESIDGDLVVTKVGQLAAAN